MTSGPPPLLTLLPRTRCVTVALFLLLFVIGCDRNRDDDAANGSDWQRPARVAVEFPEGDKNVPAKDGGPGFSPSPTSGWQTNAGFPLLGIPQAKRGGAMRFWVGGFPNTLRTVGKDSRRLTNSILRDLCYESLLERHTDNLEFIPRLATHWWVSEDRKTYRYRINPRAHWADGRPVTAGDVIATWKLLTDERILDPAQQVVFKKFDPPHALSTYLVEIRTKELSWRNFLSFSTMPVLPAHEIGGVNGSEFLRRFRFRAVTGSGPYELRDRDVRKGRFVTLRRREDYWGAKERFAIGRFNFGKIRLVTTEDYSLGLEKAKKGEVDVFRIGRAKDWAVDLSRLDKVERGLLVMQRVYNDEPQGASGIVMNMRTPPLDDVRIRKALCHLYHRRKLIEKLFYREYVAIDSYFPGRLYANPNNPSIKYDPETARRLLREAGWSERDDEGYLVKDGKRLHFTLVYSSKAAERYLSVYQEDCLKAGITIRLKQLTRASRFQLTYGDHRFELATQGWSGRIDPNPETNWLSSLADRKNTSNLAGFKDPQVDALCREYERTFDLSQRTRLVRAIDARIFRQYPCILGWRSGCNRLLYWNRFGMPDWVIGRYTSPQTVLSLWWVDAEKQRRLKSARNDESKTLDTGSREVRYWQHRRD